jgi:hypothetical protein
MRTRIGIAVLLATIIPVPQTTVPAWTALVVGESGAPQSNITVHEVWQDYTLENAPHNDALVTSATGVVTFPKRVLWRPLILNAVGIIRNKLHGSAHYLDISADRVQSFTDLCCNSRMILHPTK